MGWGGTGRSGSRWADEGWMRRRRSWSRVEAPAIAYCSGPQWSQCCQLSQQHQPTARGRETGGREEDEEFGMSKAPLGCGRSQRASQQPLVRLHEYDASNRADTHGPKKNGIQRGHLHEKEEEAGRERVGRYRPGMTKTPSSSATSKKVSSCRAAQGEARARPLENSRPQGQAEGATEKDSVGEHVMQPRMGDRYRVLLTPFSTILEWRSSRSHFLPRLVGYKQTWGTWGAAATWDTARVRLTAFIQEQKPCSPPCSPQ